MEFTKNLILFIKNKIKVNSFTISELSNKLFKMVRKLKCSHIRTNGKKCRNPIKVDGLCHLHCDQLDHPESDHEATDNEASDTNTDDVDNIENVDVVDNDKDVVVEEVVEEIVDKVPDKHDCGNSDSVKSRGLKKRRGSQNSNIASCSKDGGDEVSEAFTNDIKKEVTTDVKNNIKNEVNKLFEIQESKITYLAQMMDVIAQKIESVKVCDSKSTTKEKKYTQKTLTTRAMIEHYKFNQSDPATLKSIGEAYKIIGIVVINKHLVRAYLDSMFNRYDDETKKNFYLLAVSYFESKGYKKGF